jgi:two-component system response regulator FixJ
MAVERKVHIVDDDAAVRRSLDRLLRIAGFKTATYETPFALLEVARQLVPGCLLLDVRMPGMDGLTLQAELDRLGSRLPVVVMTGEGDVRTAVEAMKAGAVDFVEKPFANDRLLTAIEAALARIGTLNRDRDSAAAAEELATLSPREREVLDGLVAGRSNKAIAAELGISVRTVEVHRARMLERLNTRRLADAIRIAVLAQMAPAAVEIASPPS